MTLFRKVFNISIYHVPLFPRVGDNKTKNRSKIMTFQTATAHWQHCGFLHNSGVHQIHSLLQQAAATVVLN